MIRDLGDVATFEIIQESLVLTRVAIVPGEDIDPATKDAIVQGLRARLGAQVSTTVDEVPP